MRRERVAGIGRSVWVTALVLAGTCLWQASGQDRPRNPFGDVRARRAQRKDIRPGTLTLSDGATYSGQISTSRSKPLRFFDREQGAYREVPFQFISEISTEIEHEEYEKEWRWKEGGADVKVFTGRKYPWRKYITTITLIDDSTFRGDCSGPIYVLAPGERKAKRFIVHKRDKGKYGTKMEELKYIKKVVLGEEQPKNDAGTSVDK